MKVIGIDPGSRKIGMTAIDAANPARPVYVDSDTYDIGTEVTDETIAAARAYVVRWIYGRIDDLHCVYEWIVCVERTLRVYPRDSASGHFNASQATELVHSEWIGGEIASAARTIFGEKQGEHVSTVGSLEWRAGVVLRGATDADIARVVSGAVRGWPNGRKLRDNKHTRDAAGVAMLASRKHAIAARMTPAAKLAAFSAEHDPRCTIRDGAGCSYEPGCKAARELVNGPVVRGFDGEPDRSYPSGPGLR